MIEMSGHDLSSDIWSLGCVVVELITGAPPYFDLDPMAAMFNIVEKGGVIPEGVSHDLAVCTHIVRSIRAKNDLKYQFPD